MLWSIGMEKGGDDSTLDECAQWLSSGDKKAAGVTGGLGTKSAEISRG
ncbi:hypothetical protein [Photobacterium ganghwense]|nr:hypothetical protein [Photobacterium ganghwense]MBV1839981.1 hypothetical protein [Photobacterium ganghwense]QSV13807.1 hypothetical protein FH974_13935 [Photobacterium ganghwense]